MNFNWMSWFGGAKMKSYQTYSDIPNQYVSWPSTNRPSIQWRHINGPLITFRDGQIHWLTLWQRFQCAIGVMDALKLERKLRPRLTHLVEMIENMRIGK